MTSHLNEINNKINKLCWVDSEIESIIIEYDKIQIKLKQPNSKIAEVNFWGYIGYKNTGFWDEMIIESIDVLNSSDFINKCMSLIKDKYGENMLDSGCKYRNSKKFTEIKIHLIDGLLIQFVISDISIFEIN